MDFDWDDDNVGHIAKHGVDPGEAEEVLLDPHRKPASAYRRSIEHRRALVGTTEDGRYLFVVYIVRGRRIRVVSARDATDAEQRQYRRRR